MIISAVITILGWTYKAVDAAGNIEFLLIKLHVNEDVARFLGSDRAIDFFIAVSMIALVIAILYQLNRFTQPAARPPIEPPVADEFERLVAIAEDQANTIYRFVHLRRCLIGRHELRRPDPYIEFQMIVDNRSIYDIQFEEIKGAIYFAGRELTGTPKWIPLQPNILTWGDETSLAFRQNLSADDAAHLLDHEVQPFDFNRLEIRVRGVGESSAKVAGLLNQPGPPTNEILLAGYGILDSQQRESKAETELARTCPDERLHRWAENDRLSAWRMVKFIAVACELHVASDGPPPFIVFRFAIFSLTLREVSVSDEVRGSIWFKVPEHESWQLRRAISMEDNEAKQVLLRGNYSFKVRQDLTREDADYIRDNLETGFFEMHDLVLRLSGDGLNDPRLDTRFTVKANDGYQPSLREFLFPTVQG